MKFVSQLSTRRACVCTCLWRKTQSWLKDYR